MTGPGRVLVVMREGERRDLVVGSLRAEGFDVLAVEGLEQARRARSVEDVAVVLSPERGELRLVEEVARLGEGHPAGPVPVVVASAGDRVEEEVDALRAGAADWVPASRPVRVLAVRVARLAHRAETTEEVFRDDPLEVAFPRREVRVAGRPVALTPGEFEVLACLVRGRHRVLTRLEIGRVALDQPRGSAPRTVDAHVCRLRRKLGTLGRRVRTVRGKGYRYQS